MLASCRLMNLLRSGHKVLTAGFISVAKPPHGKFLKCHVLDRESTYQKCMFFVRTLSELAEEKGCVPGANTKMVKMRGLPFEATTEDIIKFFQPLNIEPVEVIIEKNRQGFTNGFAFAKFKSNDEAVKALRNHRNYIGRRYIELFLDDRPSEEYSSSTPDSSKGYKVILRGLPYEANTSDVIQFFAPLNIKPSSIEFGHDQRFNMPSGICFCCFDTYDDAVTAMKNHKAYIGRRWIEVSLAAGSAPSSQTDAVSGTNGSINVKVAAE